MTSLPLSHQLIVLVFLKNLEHQRNAILRNFLVGILGKHDKKTKRRIVVVVWCLPLSLVVSPSLSPYSLLSEGKESSILTSC